MDHIMSPLGGHQSTAKLVQPSVSKMMNNLYDPVRVGLNLESMCLIAWPRWSGKENSWHNWWWLISTITELVSSSLVTPREASGRSSQTMLHCWSCGDLLVQVLLSWPCALGAPRLPRWAPSPLRGPLGGHTTLRIFPFRSQNTRGGNERVSMLDLKLCKMCFLELEPEEKNLSLSDSHHS